MVVSAAVAGDTESKDAVEDSTRLKKVSSDENEIE